MSDVLDTIEDRIHNDFLTAVNNIITLKVELAVR